MENILEYLRGFKQDDLRDFVELYNISSEIDPNRKITGVDIFRNFEYGIPLRWLKEILNQNSYILDIGSSSTIWPVMLYKLFNCHLFATDVDMTHLDIQKHYLYNIGQVEQLGQKFRFEYQDATAMSYDHEMFDVVCGISALEHIPGDGDTKAVKEIERVLKPGGHFIFTAPFAEIFSESETDHYHFGYEKRYDLNSIENRFHESSRLSRRELLFINGIHEQSDKVNDFWYSHKLYNTLGRISMFFSLLMYNVTKEPTNFSRGFIAHYIKT